MGAIVYVAWRAAGQRLKLVAASDVFFVTYLTLASFALRKTSEELRERAEVDDEGMAVVFVIVLVAIGAPIGTTARPATSCGQANAVASAMT